MCIDLVPSMAWVHWNRFSDGVWFKGWNLFVIPRCSIRVEETGIDLSDPF